MARAGLPAPSAIKASILAALSAAGSSVREVVLEPNGSVRIILRPTEDDGINPVDLVNMDE